MRLKRKPIAARASSISTRSPTPWDWRSGYENNNEKDISNKYRLTYLNHLDAAHLLLLFRKLADPDLVYLFVPFSLVLNLNHVFLEGLGQAIQASNKRLQHIQNRRVCKFGELRELVEALFRRADKRSYGYQSVE